MDQIHRASGSPRTVILAQPESPYLSLLSRCTFRKTGASRTESIFYPQVASDESFSGVTRSKASIFTPNPYVLNLLAASSTQSISWPPTTRATD
jgi:hypothetical protein